MATAKRVVAFQYSTDLGDFVRLATEDRSVELSTAHTLEELAELAVASPIDLVMLYVGFGQIKQHIDDETREEAAERLTYPIRQATGQNTVILLVEPLHFSGRIYELESLGVVVADPSTSLEVAEAAVQRLMDAEEARSGRRDRSDVGVAN